MGDDLRNLRLFSSYSPAQVVLRYAAMEDPQPPTEPEHNDFPAAIGFVDVSGFTALSEKLNKDHGRKGAELLNQYINSYFELLISGIAGMAIGYTAINAQQYVSATTMLVITNLNKVVVVIVGVLFMHEPHGPVAMVGISIALAGGVWYALARNNVADQAKKKKKEEEEKKKKEDEAAKLSSP